MTVSNFNIKYAAMDQLYISAGKRISEWNTELDIWSKSYNQIVGMSSFEGVSATGAKTYLSEVHGILLCAIQQAFSAYMSRLLLYKQGYLNIDSNIYACLPETKMDDLSRRLSSEARELDGISRDIGSSLNSVSDIVNLPNPSKNDLEGDLDGLKKDVDSFSKKISDYESSQYNSANGDLKSLIDALERTVNECYNSGANIASYTSGSIARSLNVVELCNSAMKEYNYVKANADNIKIAGDNQTAQFKQMQDDYAAACKAREEQGIENMIKGGLGILVGIAAIVGTAGAATPLVVAGCFIGGSSFACGVGRVAEGGQDAYYGNIGDLTSKSWNPIRDTIFFGNQKAYDTWGDISMTVSCLIVPAGKALSVGGKMAAAKVCAKEFAKATAVGFGSEKITEFATDKLHLNGAESMGLNLLLNTVLYKGANAAEGKLNEITIKHKYMNDNLSSAVKKTDLFTLYRDITKAGKFDVDLAERITDTAIHEKGIQAGFSEETLGKFDELVKESIGKDVKTVFEEDKIPGWEEMSEDIKNNYIKQYLNQGAGKAIEVKNKLAEFNNLMEYKARYDTGYFRNDKYTLDDILKFKINAKLDEAGGIAARDYSKIRGGELLPRADEFISDKAIVNYVKELCSDNSALQKCTTLQEVANELNKHPVKLNLVTFQNAAPGARNIVYFGGGYGHGPIETGGPFAVPESALKGYAKEYPAYCTFKNGVFKITNQEKFGSEVLSGVPLKSENGAYLIKIKVPLDGKNISMPSVVNGGAYAPYFVSGGKLLSGQLETTVIPISTKISKSTIIGKEGISGITDNGIEYFVSLLK